MGREYGDIDRLIEIAFSYIYTHTFMGYDIEQIFKKNCEMERNRENERVREMQLCPKRKNTYESLETGI